jgi:predicted nucleotidyltransferase
MSTAERWKHRPPLPADAPERVASLPALFARHGVALGYLFGSFARTGPQQANDIDLAVLPGATTDLWELRLAIGEHLATDRFDLVDLATAPSVARFEAIRAGRLLFRASPEIENSFERRTIAEYKDGEVRRARRLRLLGPEKPE